MKTAEDIVGQKNREIVYVAPETSLTSCIIRMVEKRTGALIAGSADNILGIWTERDYLRLSVVPGFNAEKVRVSDVMTKDVCMVHSETLLQELEDMLFKKKQRHLVVLKNGMAIGLISSDDIIEATLEEKTEACKIGEVCRVMIENELKKTHVFLERLVQSSPNVIIAVDRKGVIIIWNRAAETTLGYPVEDVVDKMSVRKIYPEGIAEKIMALMRSEEYGGKGVLSSFPMVFIKKDGGKVPARLSASVIHNELGQEAGSIGIFVDFEEQLDMARRLKHTQNLLLQSEKLAAMGRLTSLIAHEVNNPLYGIMNTLELIKPELSDGSEKKILLEMTIKETQRLSDTLRKMLSFARPEPEDLRMTDVNRLLDEIITLHRKQFVEQNIRVKFDFTRDRHIIQASKNQLRQVFLNMITNARDAMQEGGTLNVRTRAGSEWFEVDIEDTGVGISEENYDKIFDNFFSTKSEVRGVGHGLSVCHSYIKEHDGDIKVKSIPGKGTLFTVLLPYHGVKKHSDSGFDTNC